MGFTKLDEGILKSSIMAESSDTFKVWIALLASCDPDGIARVSAIFLSSVCHLSLAVVEEALKNLESPDKYSRSLEEDGRRINRVDGGYFLINYDKYREFSYSNNPEAIRKREYRKKKKEEEIMGHSGTCPGHSASASSSENKIKGKIKSKEEEYTTEFESFWKEYPRKKGKREAFVIWKNLTKTSQKEILLAVPNYKKEIEILQTEENYILHAKTFLNEKKKRWEDFMPENWKKPLHSPKSQTRKDKFDPPTPEEMREATNKALGRKI